MDAPLPMGNEPTKKSRIESSSMALVSVDVSVSLQFKVRSKNKATSRAGLDPVIIVVNSTTGFWQLKSMILERVNIAWRGLVCNEHYELFG